MSKNGGKLKELAGLILAVFILLTAESDVTRLCGFNAEGTA